MTFGSGIESARFEGETDPVGELVTGASRDSTKLAKLRDPAGRPTVGYASHKTSRILSELSVILLKTPAANSGFGAALASSNGEGSDLLARLEDLTPGTKVMGVVRDGPVTVVHVDWHGGNAITLTYRTEAGQVAESVLYRDSEPGLMVAEPGRSWAFDADGQLFRLVSEARRISLAYLFDPYLAVTTSNLEPLPHQIKAVYVEMLPRQPLRFLLADDPGAGKTIMAGLLAKELMIRGDVARCLVIAPGNLVEQWQDELWTKFGLSFEIVTSEKFEASRTGNPFAEYPFLIARLDQLSRNEDIQAKLAQTDWDLVVVDEAHKMAAHYYGLEVKETKRYKLGRLLGSLTRHFLLITATPHSGKPEDFQLFLALLDADRFEGKPRDGAHTIEADDLMRRLVKEKLHKFDGRPLFPERRAYSVNYTLSPEEALLYKKVTDYVTEEMNRADRLKEAGQGGKGAIVGFALTILQRRLASSPEAIYESIKRRRERLENRLREERIAHRGAQIEMELELERRVSQLDEEDFEDDLEDSPDAEAEEIRESLVDQASAAQTIAELEAEIETLAELEAMAQSVRRSGTDRKWEELRDLIDERKEMFERDGARRKLIIFTEHRDTLNYLAERLRDRLGSADAVVTIDGSTKREERRKRQEIFTQDRDCFVLVATDAAGEGINLQRAHLMVNYDLPWNPNRIEQRFGRIHRIGQTEVCHLWNLIAGETREGQVFQRLFEKLEEQRKALGDQVFDVLGEPFEEEPLRQLLIRAIRYGDDPLVKKRLEIILDATVGDGLAKVIEERALVTDVMGPSDIEHIREEMEQAAARRLQPHYIRSFFLEAFKLLGGRIVEREPGRYEITFVPSDMRSRDREIGLGSPMLRRYERVTFEKELTSVGDKPPAELICPGHPLLDVAVDLLLERHSSLLRKGTLLIDPTDSGEKPRVLIYLEHSICDARKGRSGNSRVVSKRFEFVEVFPDGDARSAGHAPFLDYRPADSDEFSVAADVLKQEWLVREPDKIGLDFAIANTVPAHLEEVTRRVTDRVHKTEAAVRERLTREIAYWDHRAETLKEQELAGKQPKMNSGKARARAEELEGRLARRLAELDAERQLSPLPPVVVGAALVIPSGLISRLRGERDRSPDTYAKETARIERIAVDAVLEVERSLGRDPVEMPHNNPGFDIRSKDPDTGQIIFIEVKGRVEGAKNFTVTRNEILTGLNKAEDFVLALVEIDNDDNTDIRYIANPFPGTEEAFFEVTNVNWPWESFWSRGASPA